jgi:HSP20 family protein
MHEHDVDQALQEVRQLYEKLLGRPAPTIDPRGFMPFPPGIMPLDLAMRELEQLRHVAAQLEFAPAPVAWVPRADCYASPDAFVVQLEIPGIEREDVKIFFKHGECVVRGERKPTNGSSEMRLLGAERPWGPFERRFPLPMGSDPERIKAVYRNGMLEINVAVEQAGSPREMNVEAA